MKLYKRLEEEKVIIAQCSEEQLRENFRQWLKEMDSLTWKTDSGLVGAFCISGNLKLYYRHKKYTSFSISTYEYFPLLVKIKAINENQCEIRYGMVFNTPLKLAKFFTFLVGALLFPILFAFFRSSLCLYTSLFTGGFSLFCLYFVLQTLLDKHPQSAKTAMTAPTLFENEADKILNTRMIS